jgi:hypothetical protein
MWISLFSVTRRSCHFRIKPWLQDLDGVRVSGIGQRLNKALEGLWAPALHLRVELTGPFLV